jgi:hypothetical protein
MHATPPVPAALDPELYDEADRNAAAKYRPDYARHARKLGLLFGARVRDVAKFFDVTARTVDRWCALFPEFAAELAAGRSSADADVAAKLHERCLGYSHPSVKLFAHKVKDASGGEEIVITEKSFVEHYPPDVGAIEFWLTNRDPEGWKKRQQTTMDGQLTVNGGGLSGLIAATETARQAAAKPEE